MSVKLVLALAKCHIGNRSAKDVLRVLCDYADDDGKNCFPSKATILEEAELGSNAFSPALKYLVEKGWLQYKKRHKESNLYFPNAKRLYKEAEHNKKEKQRLKLEAYSEAEKLPGEFPNFEVTSLNADVSKQLHQQTVMSANSDVKDHGTVMSNITKRISQTSLNSDTTQSNNKSITLPISKSKNTCLRVDSYADDPQDTLKPPTESTATSLGKEVGLNNSNPKQENVDQFPYGQQSHVVLATSNFFFSSTSPLSASTSCSGIVSNYWGITNWHFDSTSARRAIKAGEIEELSRSLKNQGLDHQSFINGPKPAMGEALTESSERQLPAANQKVSENAHSLKQQSNFPSSDEGTVQSQVRIPKGMAINPRTFHQYIKVDKPDDLDDETWTDWCVQRIVRKRRLTVHVIKGIRNAIKQSRIELSLYQVITYMLERDWLSVKAPWLEQVF
ncbi:MAG: helix-turn-helix domain-containing protein, partial [Burkholderiales bacterium]|nr:helix-turn-helix domain-containing protein [Burkholderiales bacterium]